MRLVWWVAILFRLPDCRSFAGDHGGAVIPVPIPNTEVKGSIAEGSASPGRARVGRRQLFFCLQGQRGLTLNFPVEGVYDTLSSMRRCRINLPNRCHHLISRVAHRAFEFEGLQAANRKGRYDNEKLLWQSRLTLLARDESRSY